MIAYESEWKIINRRRGVLIEKETNGNLSNDERAELAGLQTYADDYLEREFPPDYSKLNELEELIRHQEVKGQAKSAKIE